MATCSTRPPGSKGPAPSSGRTCSSPRSFRRGCRRSPGWSCGRAACFVDQYSRYPAAGDLKVDGQLTLGENIADNEGLRLAYRALVTDLAGKDPPAIDGFTARQRFLLGWAQIRCANLTEQRARSLARTDPHSPGRWRVNGVVSNMAEFREVFHCPATAPMVRPEPCRIW